MEAWHVVSLLTLCAQSAMHTNTLSKPYCKEGWRSHAEKHRLLAHGQSAHPVGKEQNPVQWQTQQHGDLASVSLLIFQGIFKSLKCFVLGLVLSPRRRVQVTEQRENCT